MRKSSDKLLSNFANYFILFVHVWCLGCIAGTHIRFDQMKLSEYLLRRVLYIRHEQEFWNFPFIAISQLLELQVNYNFEKFKLTQIILWLDQKET